MRKILWFCFLPTLLGWGETYQSLRQLFSFEHYEKRIHSLATFPHVKVFSIGKSHGNRNLWMIEIKPPHHTEHRILLMGSTHPIEWHAQEIPLRLAEYLAPRADKLLVTCYILPLVNPDGFAYMQVIPVFYASNRKNRYFPPTEKRPSVYTTGVDLNRNFSYQWKKTSDDPTHPYYSGPFPMSEPETQALERFVSTTPLSLVLSFHSPGNVVQYPWGYTKTPQTNQRLIHFAHWLAKNIGPHYRAIQDSANYIKSGCEIDWFYGEKQIPAFRIEVSKKLIDTSLQDYPAIQKMIEKLVTTTNDWWIR